MSATFTFAGRRSATPESSYDEYIRAAYGQEEIFSGAAFESGLEQIKEVDWDFQRRIAEGQGSAVVYGPWPGSAPQMANSEDGAGSE